MRGIRLILLILMFIAFIFSGFFGGDGGKDDRDSECEAAFLALWNAGIHYASDVDWVQIPENTVTSHAKPFFRNKKWEIESLIGWIDDNCAGTHEVEYLGSSTKVTRLYARIAFVALTALFLLTFLTRRNRGDGDLRVQPAY
jgi:hypothetical protein